MNNADGKRSIGEYKLHVLKYVAVIFQHAVISFLVFRVFVGEGALSLKGSPADFSNMIEGTAARPFVLRTLIPSSIRLMRDELPESIKNQIKTFFAARNWFVDYLKSEKAVEYSIALFLCFIFFLGFSFVLRCLAKRFYSQDSLVQHLAVFSGMMIIPLCSAYGHYIYDPATIFLFSFGVLLVVKERLIPMLAFFPLAVINKETSLLLIPVFIAYQFGGRMPVIKIAAVSVVMGLIWFFIRMLIAKEFAANTGALAEFHFFDHNLRLFANPAAACFFLVTVTFLGVLIAKNWKSKNQFLRWGFLLVFLPLFILSIFFGFVDELRQFYEVVPFAALLMAPAISEMCY